MQLIYSRDDLGNALSFAQRGLFSFAKKKNTKRDRAVVTTAIRPATAQVCDITVSTYVCTTCTLPFPLNSLSPFCQSAGKRGL